MNILISTFGVRGDVQPYLALSVELRLPGFKQLNAEKLAEAIQVAVTDNGLRARAAALGEKIRAEDGVGRAVGIIERCASARTRGGARNLEHEGPNERKGAKREDTKH